MLVSEVFPVEIARWVGDVEEILGRFCWSYFLLVRDFFELAVLRLEKSLENIDTESWSQS